MKAVVAIFSILTIVAIVAFVNWLVWLAYTHFQIKFGWMPLSYWEVLVASFLISTIGGWLFKSKK